MLRNAGKWMESKKQIETRQMTPTLQSSKACHTSNFSFAHMLLFIFTIKYLFGWCVADAVKEALTGKIQTQIEKDCRSDGTKYKTLA